jgi:hypothetical protein
LVSTKGCAVGNVDRDTTSCVHPCPTDGAPCEVVMLFAERMEAERFAEGLSAVKWALPCWRCRDMETQAQALQREPCC